MFYLTKKNDENIYKDAEIYLISLQNMYFLYFKYNLDMCLICFLSMSQILKYYMPSDR